MSVVVGTTPAPIVVVDSSADSATSATVSPAASDEVTAIGGVPGPPGPPGPSGEGGYAITLERPAHGALSGHRVVVERSDGTWEYADNATADHMHRPPALTTGASADGALCQAVAFGEVDEPSWGWTPGLPLFLGETGVLTHTAPVTPAVFLLEVGAALSATRIFFDPKTPIRLT